VHPYSLSPRISQRHEPGRVDRIRRGCVTACPVRRLSEEAMDFVMERYRGYDIAVRKRPQGDAWQATATDRDGASITTGIYANHGNALAEARLIVDRQISLTRGR